MYPDLSLRNIVRHYFCSYLLALMTMGAMETGHWQKFLFLMQSCAYH